VVHPPFGKILIAGGEWAFGLSPFGWRCATAVVGSLAILVLARTARRMTRSTLLGCVAGLLLALDGLEFVMSRTALLDIFVMFWVLAAFAALVADRDRSRAHLADAAVAGRASPPRLGIAGGGWRPGVPGAGVRVEVERDLVRARVRRPHPRLGHRCPARGRVRRPPPRPGGRQGRGPAGWARCAVLPVATYLATWAAGSPPASGYDRQWAAEHGIHTPVIAQLVSLFEYHKAMLAFNTGLTTHHPYESKPWTWLLMSRPVSYFWCPNSGAHPACSNGKAQEVLAIGTPAIWWVSILALLVCLIWWLTRRDWRAGAILVAVIAGWLPWFAFADRTQFYFYAVTFVPYLVLSITLCLGLIIGPAMASPRRRATGAAVAGAYLLGVLLNFAYLYPVLAAKVIPYSQWLARMWYHGWI
jgi:dolichyl-phosphate-mannose--protein O-mannosyl transferase